MRRLACSLAVIAMLPAALHAQRLEPVPRGDRVAVAPNGDWCFGVKLRTRDRCADFMLLEIGARFRVTGKTDHSTADPAHAYPTLENHGYLAAGLAHRVAPRSALGVVGEYGNGGGERLALGVRFDQQLSDIARLDLSAGAMRVQAHQRGVTRRRWAHGTFADAAVRASDLLVLQARVEHVPGAGTLVKPANATYIGARVEGGGAVKTTIVASALMAVLIVYIWVAGGGKGS